MKRIKIGNIVLITTLGLTHMDTSPAPKPIKQWETLKKSNNEFVRDHKMSKKRKGLVHAQNPPCIILGCADSRIPPEVVFGQNLGDFFVLRVAGEVVDAVVVDSIEYAIHTFPNAGLIVVLGHSNCGAVGGALQHLQDNKGVADVPHSKFSAVLLPIERAILDAGIDINKPDALPLAVQANVRYVADQLMAKSSSVKKAIKSGKLAIVGAEYSLETGEVHELFIINK